PTRRSSDLVSRGPLQVHGHLRLQIVPRRVSTSASVLSPRFCFCSAFVGREDLFSSVPRRPALQARRPMGFDIQTVYDIYSAFAPDHIAQWIDPCEGEKVSRSRVRVLYIQLSFARDCF